MGYDKKRGIFKEDTLRCLYANANGIWGKRNKLNTILVQENPDLFL